MASPVPVDLTIRNGSGRPLSATTKFLYRGALHGSHSGWRRGRFLLKPAGPDQAPAPILYLRCGGCGEVTAHSADREFFLPVPASLTRVLAGGAVLRETLCDVCGYAQPRVIGDQVESDTEIECQARRHWVWFSWRSCRRVFLAPAASPWPVCPWCLTVQHPLLSGWPGRF
jgi:hypothetical protein